MSGEVVTAIDAKLDQNREQELLEGYRQLKQAPRPEGLLRAELLLGQAGKWRIQTTWRDREALMDTRKSGGAPAALELLDRLGAEHSHGAFTVEESYLA